MKQWPDFNQDGDLPPGIHQATVTEILEHFGKGTPQRRIVARRLERICTLVCCSVLATQARRYEARYCRGDTMITSDQELQVTLDRIAHFQRQVAQVRQVETNPVNYRLSVSGFLAEIDRMNLEVRDYLWLHPSE